MSGGYKTEDNQEQTWINQVIQNIREYLSSLQSDGILPE
jgi:hypothetical protein